MRKLQLLLSTLALTIGLLVTPIGLTSASADPANCATLAARIASFTQQAQQLGQAIDEHNARAGSVDRTNPSAVAAYNNEADQLDSRRSALVNQSNGLKSESATCGSSQAIPQVPSLGGPSAPKPSLPPKSTSVEKRNAPLEVKINNGAYLKKYYKSQDPNGVMQRRSVNQRDANGVPVPRIYENREKPGTFQLFKDRPVQAAQFKSTAPPTVPTVKDITSASRIVNERAQAIADVSRLQQQRATEMANGSPIRPSTAASLKDAYRRQTQYGEQLGEVAGRQSIARDFPASQYRVRELTDPGRRAGSGDFDQVFSVTPRTGGTERIVINEAKGPAAGLGSRKGLDGQYYQQGTRGYLESVLPRLLATNPVLAVRIQVALTTGTLDYRVVQAALTRQGSWAGYAVKSAAL